jgi:hypothetical protein
MPRSVAPIKSLPNEQSTIVYRIFIDLHFKADPALMPCPSGDG